MHRLHDPAQVLFAVLAPLDRGSLGQQMDTQAWLCRLQLEALTSQDYMQQTQALGCPEALSPMPSMVSRIERFSAKILIWDCGFWDLMFTASRLTSNTRDPVSDVESWNRCPRRASLGSGLSVI